ncbi:MAG: hypothetical protein EHM18_05120 [Acidobacteria bacterium]|nr:MAG: hypothetical protein EHM18_05120 [Acidobacteriota bacterium]
MKLADNPEFISGVHNYCDRWCERCHLRARCAVFAMEEEDSSESSGRQAAGGEAGDEAFIKKLGEIFQVTLEMVYEWAEKAGVDLSECDSEEEWAKHEAEREETREHPLVSDANRYRERVRDWFRLFGSFLGDAEGEAEQDGQAPGTEGQQVPKPAPNAEHADLQESGDIILWYHTLLAAKIGRAVGGKLRCEDADFEDLSGDSDGSAKVALIAIDRSMAAWWNLLGHLPERKREIAGFLAFLNRLRRETEKTFPLARKFVRPGFDEDSDTSRELE